MDEGEMVASLMIMAIALSVAGRRRDELQVRNFQAEWPGDVLNSLVECPPSAITSSHEHPDAAKRCAAETPPLPSGSSIEGD
jgi:hypothetical protein